MLKQTVFPKTPEEVAMSLSKLTEKEQYMVKGIIIGLTERIQTTGNRQSEARESA